MNKPMYVRQAADGDVSACLTLEDSLREDRPASPKNGFLLSGGGESESSYREYVSYGSFFVATSGEDLVGFAFALPPGSPRMNRIKASKDRFVLRQKQDVFEIGDLAWMAKVGVREEVMRSGIGTALYGAIFQSHPNWHFLTTTVRAPVRNVPSERFHEGCGFICIGELPLGNRGAFRDVVCNIYYRRGTILERGGSGELRDQKRQRD